MTSASFPSKGSNGGVRFVYDSDIPRSSVAVAGTFNNWNGDRHYMTPMETGQGWELEMNISPGRHLYKFVIDGEDWILDPLNPNVSEDGQNNSSITVTGSGDVLIRTCGISEEHPGWMYENFTAVPSPDWLRSSVLYELHLRAFTETGFRRLTAKIPYFKELGVNTLWLMPFHEVGLEGRKGIYGDPYAVRDFYSIDPDLGTKEDLLMFMQAAHDSGLRVILDWVLNRTSVDHPLTQSHPEFYTRNERQEIYYEVPNRDYFAGLDMTNREMRSHIIGAMKYWITEFDFDGIRLDDSDLAPHDYLAEIRQALQAVKEDFILISQAYDEYHHLESCDLTYDGNPRILVSQMAAGDLNHREFAAIYQSYKYSFPKNALRMGWLEEKEQSRIGAHLGRGPAWPAATVLLTLEGVPCLMMGQEFNEDKMNTWASLFGEFKLNWGAFDAGLHEHYRFLIHLRTQEPAFWTGSLEFIPSSEDRVLSYVRRDGDSAYLILVNLSGKARFVQFAPDFTADAWLRNDEQLVYRAGCGAPGSHRPEPETPGLGIGGWETLIFRNRR